MSQALIVTVVSKGRDGTPLYADATSKSIVGRITQEGHETVVQPQEVNGRVLLNLATGLNGWVEKRSVRFLQQLNIDFYD